MAARLAVVGRPFKHTTRVYALVASLDSLVASVHTNGPVKFASREFGLEPDQLRHFPPAEHQPGASLVFTNRNGQPLRRNTLADASTRLRQTRAPDEARGWHSPRHTSASWLIEGGLSVRAVQARLGHSSATETLDVYAHLWPDSDNDTRNVIESRLAINHRDTSTARH